MKQYFSKLYNEWKDLTAWDCEESLRKYKYQIREKPKKEQKVKECDATKAQ
jgi:hypothetical protein